MQPYAGLKAMVTAFAVVVACVHIWVPSIPVDSITLALVVIAVIPWLQPIFKTIKLPGGLELTLQEIKQEVKNARGAAQSAERKADLAVSGLATSTTGHPATDTEQSRENRPPEDRLEALASVYEDIRRRQTAGAARTQAMTNVVRKMIQLAGSLPNLDVAPMLSSTSAGQRLAAYAYLYARPNPTLLAALVESVTKMEDKPFGQYWGLLAIGLNVEDGDINNIPESVARDLIAFSERVRSGTDRDYEIGRILSRIGLPEAAPRGGN